MNIQILHLIEGAKQALGLTVIIDVFRAFTTACYIMNNNPDKLIPVGDINIAYKIKSENPETILVGERNEKMPEGFQFGNSPSQVRNFDFTNKTVIHTTSAGTNGIANAVNADEIITGSFVNANAVIEYIKNKKPEIVSLVCMGFRAESPTDEDTFCAEFIKSGLLNKEYDLEQKIPILREGAGARFFIDEKQHYAPKEDFYLCTETNVFDFILKTNPNGELKKHSVNATLS